MKKLTFSLLSLVICLASCLTFSACKSQKGMKYNTTYAFKGIEFMGFSGDRASIQKYIDSSEAQSDNNNFIEYFELAMKMNVSFSNNGKGTLTIPKLASTLEENTTETDNLIASGYAAGIINRYGDFVVSFDYSIKADTLTIDSVHTNIETIGDNGDLTFTEALEMIASKTKTANKISNEDANIVKIDGNNLVLKLEFEHRTSKNTTNPDVVSTLHVILSR